MPLIDRAAPASLFLALLSSDLAQAFTANVTSGSPQLYLQVGAGAFAGTYNSGGTPGRNPTINTVQVTLAPNAVGSGTAQAMTSNSAAATSNWDGYAFCNPPAEVYVGAAYRSNRHGAAAAATLTASVPSGLSNGSGASIPFSQISWTSSGNGDGASAIQPFPSGSFAPGHQTIGTIARNQWAESCHRFSYRNANIVPAGTYTGRVTYTLSAP